MHCFLQVEQAQTLGTKAQVKESIQKRVEAAVDVGQAGSVGVSQEQEAQEAAGARSQVQVGESIHALQHVEGSPADGKNHHQSGDDLQQPLLLLVLLAQVVEMTSDGAADEAVEDGHGQERQKKTQGRGGQAESGDPQELVPLVHGYEAEVHGACGVVALLVVHGGSEEQSGHSQQAGQQPNSTQGCQHGAP